MKHVTFYSDGSTGVIPTLVIQFGYLRSDSMFRVYRMRVKVLK